MTANQKDRVFYLIVGIVPFALLYTVVGRVS